MRKKNLFLILIIVMMVSLIGTFVACKPTTNNPGGNSGTGSGSTENPTEIVDTTFYNAMKASEDNDIKIIIVNDGIQIYSYTNINGRETVKNDYNIDTPSGVFTASDSLIELKSEDFKNAEITETEKLDIAIYSASIADAKDLLGLAGDIKNATMDISIKLSTQEFVQATVSYLYTANSAQYDVRIEIIARN